MKITKKEVNLLIGLLGILIAFCAYQFGYLKVMEKTEALETQNNAMESEIRQYESWMQNKDTYVSETEKMQRQIADWINEFPANALPEDDMKLAYQMDNRNLGQYLFINAMTFSEPGLLYTTDYSAQEAQQQGAAGVAGATSSGSSVPSAGSAGILYPVYSLYQQNTGMGIDCSYEGIKNMVERVYSDKNRKSIQSITLAFDASTGRMSGNISMNAYYVFGSDKQYSQPDLTPVRQGTGNIFGTLEGTQKVEQ